MELHVVFAQRKGQYPGQYGPEAIGCATEYEVDENPDYLEGVERNAREDDDLDRVARIVLEVDEAAVQRILYPDTAPLEAKVVEPGEGG